MLDQKGYITEWQHFGVIGDGLSFIILKQLWGQKSC